jgi:prolipoprotein diacylglyceryltransferase
LTNDSEVQKFGICLENDCCFLSYSDMRVWRSVDVYSTRGITIAFLFCRGNFVASEIYGGVSVRMYQDLVSQAVLTSAWKKSDPVAGVVLNSTVPSFWNSVRCLQMEVL